METTCKGEIKTWLTTVFEKYNFRDILVKLQGNSEKGDGYLGDIYFVTATAKTQDNSTQTFDLVLKCSKKSQALREKTPVASAFLNEIYFYTTVVPFLTNFQEQKHVKPFDSVAKCYGAITDVNKEVLVFENLKKRGFELWPKKLPLPRSHIELVLKEYGKYHAISVALKEQNPEKFEEFTRGFKDTFKEFIEAGEMILPFDFAIDQAADLLQSELDDSVLAKWRNLKSDVSYTITTMLEEIDGLKVITHGDCWNNNFMYQTREDGGVNVALLDFQLTKYSSPVTDLSYFLFSNISGQDLEDLNQLLELYHKSFVNHLRSFGVNKADLLYPLDQFLKDWKKYSTYGIIMGALAIRICSTQKEDVVGMDDLLEGGRDFTEMFTHVNVDLHNIKIRTRPLVEYVSKT